MLRPFNEEGQLRPIGLWAGSRRSFTMGLQVWLLWGVLISAFSGTARGSGDPLSFSEAKRDFAQNSGLSALLEVPALRGARVGALVVHASDGTEIWSQSPDMLLAPASNMKILTSVAALATLGPSARFETQVFSDRLIDSEGTVGQLRVRGSGDPVLNTEDWWRVAADLRRQGLRRIEGNLLVDDTAFDDVFWHPAWGPVSSRAYHGPVGALTANYGTFFAHLSPAEEVDQPPIVVFDPPVEYLRRVGSARTGGMGEATVLNLSRGEVIPGRESVRIDGTVRLGEKSKAFPRSVSDPGLYAGSVLKMHLESLGVSVGGEVIRGDPSQSVMLLNFKGRPLSEIISLAMKYSNNAMTEMLVKALALNSGEGEGGWPAGMSVLRERLLAMNIIGEEAILVDGSGLAVTNRVSARMIVNALEVGSHSFGMGPEFVASLPIAALDGTLRDRLLPVQGRVRAKTGLLNDSRVIALSGTVEDGQKRRKFFSILVNGYPGTARQAMDAVDAWVAEIAR
ncbi:MAG: D-alanyl-D-alanine carboxypeptidase/D-alanyl-D-alanine-endopeptidase [Deltaproteobacteria bacterium]|nr:D-alanyl-D-alanine carboxypeptidase/D-alanyl-D-alanine-endopeptidase [Deltaproteobacteria bacterium]